MLIRRLNVVVKLCLTSSVLPNVTGSTHNSISSRFSLEGGATKSRFGTTSKVIYLVLLVYVPHSGISTSLTAVTGLRIWQGLRGVISVRFGSAGRRTHLQEFK